MTPGYLNVPGDCGNSNNLPIQIFGKGLMNKMLPDIITYRASALEHIKDF
jgi:hypothetical protein